MEQLTPEAIMTAGVVILAIFGIIITIDKVIDIWKKWRTPTTDVAKKLAADKTRLDKHDEDISKLQGSLPVLCEGVLALLDHELHNGNADQMQKARDNMMDYLYKGVKK